MASICQRMIEARRSRTGAYPWLSSSGGRLGKARLRGLERRRTRSDAAGARSARFVVTGACRAAGCPRSIPSRRISRGHVLPRDPDTVLVPELGLGARRTVGLARAREHHGRSARTACGRAARAATGNRRFQPYTPARVTPTTLVRLGDTRYSLTASCRNSRVEAFAIAAPFPYAQGVRVRAAAKAGQLQPMRRPETGRL